VFLRFTGLVIVPLGVGPAAQAARILIHFDTGEIVELWHNPTNYQSGGAAYTLEFTAAPTATSVQFQYQASTAVGPFAVSDVSLEGEIPSYTIARKTYFLGSAAIATRISGDPDGNNGLFYIHTDHPSTGLGQA
jgi:hypothetical protein